MSEELRLLTECTQCPRLVALREEVQEQYPEYHAGPVGSWGDTRVRILIVGLAPGLHGAARTGRAFVGDDSGKFLFAALHRNGLATDADANKAKLVGVRITNVVKCLPPKNSPKAEEVNACAGYLRAELDRYCPANARQPRVLMTLGGLAHNAVCRSMGIRGAPFRHGGIYPVSPKLNLVSSFHPSRLNVNTGRLTPQMIDEVLLSCTELLSQPI